jgi:hypothetical protein
LSRTDINANYNNITAGGTIEITITISIIELKNQHTYLITHHLRRSRPNIYIYIYVYIYIKSIFDSFVISFPLFLGSCGKLYI